MLGDYVHPFIGVLDIHRSSIILKGAYNRLAAIKSFLLSDVPISTTRDSYLNGTRFDTLSDSVKRDI